MEKRKVTKAMVIETIKAQVETMSLTGGVTAEDVIAYCDNTLAQIQAKADKARERAAEKKAAGDDIKNAILAVMTDQFQTREQITEALADPEMTVAKVGTRLTQLAADGAIVKEQVKLENGKKMCYKLA